MLPIVRLGIILPRDDGPNDRAAANRIAGKRSGRLVACDRPQRRPQHLRPRRPHARAVHPRDDTRAWARAREGDPQLGPGDRLQRSAGDGRALLGAAEGRRTHHGAVRAVLSALALDGMRSAVAGAVAVSVGCGRGDQRAARGLLPPAVEHGDLVPAGVSHAEVGHLRPGPIPLPVEFLLEGGKLLELVAVIARAVDRIGARAVAQRGGGDLVERDLEVLAAKARGVPGHDHRAGHQAPTSAWIAPGPSAVLPWPSSVAPTRIEILPRCLFSSISWCASATPSKASVRHSTGRIWPDSISSLAFVHS